MAELKRRINQLLALDADDDKFPTTYDTFERGENGLHREPTMPTMNHTQSVALPKSQHERINRALLISKEDIVMDKEIGELGISRVILLVVQVAGSFS